MAHMDIFTGDAFSQVTLTDALESVPYKPSLLGSLGLFDEKPVRTTHISIEKRDDKLSLIPVSGRGEPLPQGSPGYRNIRNFNTVRVAKGDRLEASEIQNIRAFGSESELEQVQAEIMRRMEALRNDLELTHENMRLGAIRGVVTDATGGTLIDWFSEWGIAAPTPVSFALNSDGTNVRAKCHEIVRAMARASGGAFTPSTRVAALCGDTFFDKLTGHKHVRDTYLNWQDAADLRGNSAFGEFDFGGIRWINYRGTDDGAVGISPEECRFFPIGAPGAFQVARSPGESFDLVNTLGRPFYAMQVPDRDRNMHVDVEVYSYPLYICTRPGMLKIGQV